MEKKKTCSIICVFLWKLWCQLGNRLNDILYFFIQMWCEGSDIFKQVYLSIWKILKNCDLQLLYQRQIILVLVAQTKDTHFNHSIQIWILVQGNFFFINNLFNHSIQMWILVQGKLFANTLFQMVCKQIL